MIDSGDDLPVPTEAQLRAAASRVGQLRGTLTDAETDVILWALGAAMGLIRSPLLGLAPAASARAREEPPSGDWCEGTFESEPIVPTIDPTRGLVFRACARCKLERCSCYEPGCNKCHHEAGPPW